MKLKRVRSKYEVTVPITTALWLHLCPSYDRASTSIIIDHWAVTTADNVPVDMNRLSADDVATIGIAIDEELETHRDLFTELMEEDFINALTSEEE